MTKRLVHRLVAGMLLLVAPNAAAAAAPDAQTHQWLPSPDDASWVYSWTDSSYATTPTKESYTLDQRAPGGFRLRWTTDGLGNPDGAVSSSGTIDYAYEDVGIVNTTWNSTPAPGQFPILCASVSGCGNGLHSTHYMLIWGTRAPVLREPLVQGLSWAAVGGQGSDVTSTNRYTGSETVRVPAFPLGVTARKVASEITQAGAIGDPYGSGTRTVWWVYGVGPVKVEFRHTGGQNQVAELVSTNLVPLPAPTDLAYFPLERGRKTKYRITNTKHLKQPSTQQVEVAQVQNGSARVDVKSLKGPLRLQASYVLSQRLTGVTTINASIKAATRLKIPKLGPLSAPSAQRRKLLTPIDFMSFGFNPIITAYPKRKDTWSSHRSSRDFTVFGVTGKTTVLGTQKVITRAGTYHAQAIRSTLKQAGFRYGSGTRTMWFAPGVGLVKLRFVHKDGSVTNIERVP